MAVKQDYRFAVLKYYFSGPFGGDHVNSLIWPHQLVHDVFMANNGYSVRHYWMRATLNMLRPTFDFPNSWWPLHRSHMELSHDRGAMINAVREDATENGIDLSKYDGVVAFMNPPGTNAGALGGNAVLDQAGQIPMYLHEVGHMMGFQHAFGITVPIGDPDGPLYNDQWDVMGNQWKKAQQLEPFTGWEDIEPLAGQGFWRTTVPPCAANLWRRFWNTNVFDDGQRVAYVRRGESRWVRSWTTAHGSTLTEPLLMVAQDGDDGPTVTVELRLRYGPDAVGWTATSVRGIVAVHSFRYRNLAPGQNEVFPAWEEGAFEMGTGNWFDTPGEGRWKITVTGVDYRDGNTRAEIRID